MPLDQSELVVHRLVDELYTERPCRGSRGITAILKKAGHLINRKRIQSVMRLMGIAGTHPGPHTSKPHPEHKKFPYLLRGFQIVKPVQVWSTDITYIRLPGGFVYLCAVIDWHSRLVLSHRLSNTLDGVFCVEALEEAIMKYGVPEIFNTDQGVQFTCQGFVKAILDRGIQISMDGRGRALDNVFIERLWRSLKYEEIYLNEYRTVAEVKKAIRCYFIYYNTKRLHQSLNYETPYKTHFGYEYDFVQVI